MKRFNIVVALAVMALGAAPGLYAQPAYQDVLPSGSVLRVKLDQSLKSTDAQRGDQFTATVEPGADGSDLPTGTKVEGEVTQVRHATKHSPAVMDVAFRTLRLPDGETYPMEAELTSLDSRSVTRTASGRLMSTSRHSSKRRLQLVGYGAGAGFILGALTHGNALTDALLGAAGGYAVGMLSKERVRNNEVTLKQGTTLGVRLDRELALSDTGDHGPTLR